MVVLNASVYLRSQNIGSSERVSALLAVKMAATGDRFAGSQLGPVRRLCPGPLVSGPLVSGAACLRYLLAPGPLVSWAAWLRAHLSPGPLDSGAAWLRARLALEPLLPGAAWLWGWQLAA